MEKIQLPFMVKTLSKLDREGSFPNTTKATHEKYSIILCVQMEAFPPRSGTRQGFQLSLLILNIILQVLAVSSGKTKKLKIYKIRGPAAWPSG